MFYQLVPVVPNVKVVPSLAAVQKFNGSMNSSQCPFQSFSISDGSNRSSLQSLRFVQAVAEKSVLQAAQKDAEARRAKNRSFDFAQDRLEAYLQYVVARRLSAPFDNAQGIRPMSRFSAAS
jgi:hypothetical protein